MEERVEAQKRLDASTKRGQDQAERVRIHKEREEKRRQQREIERKNREAKAARKAEHERVQQEIAARKAALIAQGITPESRSERKRRLAREAAERAAHGPHAQTVSRDTKLERFRSPSGPVSTQPGPPEPATIKTTPGRPPASPGERPEQLPDQVRTSPAKPMPQVKYKKRRTIPLDSLFGPKNDSKENPS